MKIRSLELHNYRRHHRTTIEWPDGVMAVLGRNGSGKSTILEAIGFALFGVPATRTGKDLLRWDGAGPMDSMWVALEFELAGEAIRVHRELRGKGLTPSATLTVDGRVAVDPGAGSNEAVTQDIERRFGMDRDTFFTTLVAQQGDLDRLASMTPARRKQLLLEMLGIDDLDRAIERARHERRDLETKVEAIRSALPDPAKLQEAREGAKQRVAQAQGECAVHTESWDRCKQQLVASQGTLDALEKQGQTYAQAQAALEKARHEVQAIDNQFVDVDSRLKQALAAQDKDAQLAEEATRLAPRTRALDAATAWQQAQAQVAELEARLQGLTDDADGDVGRLEEALAQATQRRTQLQHDAAVARAKAAQDQEHLDQLANLGDAAECPTCMRPLETHLPQLQDRLQTSLAHVQAAAQAAAAQLPGIDQEIQNHQAALQRARDRDAVQRELAAAHAALPPAPEQSREELEQLVASARAAHEERLRLHAALDALPRLQAQHAELQQRQQQATHDLQAAQAALDATPDPSEPLAQARTEHAQLAAAERDAERALLAAKSALELAQRDLSNAEARVAERAEQTKKLQATEEEARYWAALASGRGKGMLEEFKAHLVGRIGPAIGREASRLLSRFTGGRYTEVSLDAEYNVFVSDAGKRYSLDRFSGGESDLVHLAIRLAVSRLLVERSSAEMRFLALDEVFGSLDAERRHLVLAALQELGSLYSQVMLVTHHDSLRDALDAALLVEERDGMAVVSLHAG